MSDDENNEMKLPGRGALEAYISQAGLICLKQDDFMGGHSVVMMLHHDIPTVIEWLQELAACFPLKENQ